MMHFSSVEVTRTHQLSHNRVNDNTATVSQDISGSSTAEVTQTPEPTIRTLRLLTQAGKASCFRGTPDCMCTPRARHWLRPVSRFRFLRRCFQTALFDANPELS